MHSLPSSKYSPNPREFPAANTYSGNFATSAYHQLNIWETPSSDSQLNSLIASNRRKFPRVDHSQQLVTNESLGRHALAYRVSSALSSGSRKQTCNFPLDAIMARSRFSLLFLFRLRDVHVEKASAKWVRALYLENDSGTRLVAALGY